VSFDRAMGEVELELGPIEVQGYIPREDPLSLLPTYEIPDQDGTALAYWEWHLRKGLRYSWTYDNAVACLAGLAVGTSTGKALARDIGRTLLKLQDDDGAFRCGYVDGFLRDSAGDLRVPGVWNADTHEWWIVPREAPERRVGDNCWAGIALVHLFRAYGDRRYLEGARRAGRFVLGYRDGVGGGFWGGDCGHAKAPLRWKSFEHALDACCLFSLLLEEEEASEWKIGLESAKRFLALEENWKSDEGRFGSGGAEQNGRFGFTHDPVLDTQVWAALVLLDPRVSAQLDDGLAAKVREAASWALATCRTQDACTFGAWTPESTTPWWEGTAFAALAAMLLAHPAEKELIAAQKRNLSGVGPTSLLPATSPPSHTALGFSYYPFGATAPTAWTALLLSRVNPYYLTPIRPGAATPPRDPGPLADPRMPPRPVETRRPRRFGLQGRAALDEIIAEAGRERKEREESKQEETTARFENRFVQAIAHAVMELGVVETDVELIASSCTNGTEPSSEGYVSLGPAAFLLWYLGVRACECGRSDIAARAFEAGKQATPPDRPRWHWSVALRVAETAGVPLTPEQFGEHFHAKSKYASLLAKAERERRQGRFYSAEDIFEESDTPLREGDMWWSFFGQYGRAEAAYCEAAARGDGALAEKRLATLRADGAGFRVFPRGSHSPWAFLAGTLLTVGADQLEPYEVRADVARLGLEHDPVHEARFLRAVPTIRSETRARVRFPLLGTLSALVEGGYERVEAEDAIADDFFLSSRALFRARWLVGRHGAFGALSLLLDGHRRLLPLLDCRCPGGDRVASRPRV
ncbi:MAG: hypothetical protein AB1778_03145, partial [Candidatus Bipolaricaulota bacterium]